MKRIVFSLLLAFSSLSLFAQKQEINNFVFENNQLYWQYIYEFDSDNEDAVKTWFKSAFEITEKDESHFFGSMNQGFLPYKEVGYTKLSVIATFTCPCNLHFELSFKEGRYRVIVDNIEWVDSGSINGTSAGPQAISIYRHAIKNGAISNKFMGEYSKQLNEILTYCFTYKMSFQDDDNW